MSDGKFVCWSFVGIMVLELGCFVGRHRNRKSLFDLQDICVDE